MRILLGFLLLAAVAVAGFFVLRDGEPSVEPAAGSPETSDAGQDRQPAAQEEDLDRILADAGESSAADAAAGAGEESPLPAKPPPPPSSPVSPPSPPPLPPTGPPGDLPFGDHPAQVSRTIVKMDPPLMSIGQDWLEESGRKNFSMPLPGGREVTVDVDRFVSIGEDGGEFTGTVEGFPDSEVRLSYRGTGEAGSIRLPSENRLFLLMPSGDGSVVFQEMEMDEFDSSTGPGLPPPSQPPPDFVPELPPQLRDAEGGAPAVPPAPPTAPGGTGQ